MQNMQTAMQAMDVALKQTVSMRDETKVFARAIFWRDDTKSRSLGDGAEVISSSLSLTCPVPCGRAVFTFPRVNWCCRAGSTEQRWSTTMVDRAEVEK